MSREILPLKQLGESDLNKPYFSFPAALEKHILADPAELAQPPNNPPGIDLLAGKIPNYQYAGLVRSGSEHFVAFDHTAAVIEQNRIEIMPASKSGVDKEGNIRQEGLIVMETDDWRLKIAGYVINVALHPWFAHRMKEENRMGNIIGGIALVRPRTLDLPEYEVKDIDSKSGVVVANSRRFFI